MNGFLYVALGGALGASARHLLGLITLRLFGAGFPYATFIANICGGFLMGLLFGWLSLRGSGENLRLFLGVGLLGGFTTFSSFSLDVLLMYQKKSYGIMFAYISGSVFLSVLALMIGIIMAHKAFGT